MGPGSKESVEAEYILRVISYLDLLPSHELQLTFLPQSELILDHFGPGGDGELEVVPILYDFRHSLDILPLLDDVVRQTW